MLSTEKPRIGINGFGRMGFCALRLAIERDLNVVALNASRTPEEIARTYQYDTVHGRAGYDVSIGEDYVIIDGKKIALTSERDASKIPWEKSGVEYVIDCTGKFLTWDLASQHLEAGAKKVILSSPVKNVQEIPMFVYGVNHQNYSKDFKVISGASCTTNCLAPVAKVVNDNFGIKHGIMSTIHALTGKQPSVDGHDKKDPRVARSAHNIIPTTTGAAKAIGKVIPELNGKLDGMAYRVPVEDVSVVDLVVCLEKPASYEEVCEAIRKASENEMHGVIKYVDDLLVSSDFIGEKVTSNFDADAGIAMTENFMKLVIWYDNEFGYMNQLLNLLEYAIEVDNK